MPDKWRSSSYVVLLEKLENKLIVVFLRCIFFCVRNYRFRNKYYRFLVDNQHLLKACLPNLGISIPIKAALRVSLHRNQPESTLRLSVINQMEPYYIDGYIRDFIPIDTVDKKPKILKIFNDSCFYSSTSDDALKKLFAINTSYRITSRPVR